MDSAAKFTIAEKQVVVELKDEEDLYSRLA